MKFKFSLMSYLLPVFLWSSLGQARPQATDYMACYRSSPGTMVQLMVVPQAYSGGNMGKAEPIVSKSCDKKTVRGQPVMGSSGRMLEGDYHEVVDCTAQIQEIDQIWAQMRWSGACPPTQAEQNAMKRQRIENARQAQEEAVWD